MSEEAAIGSALADLEKWLMSRAWKTDDGRELLPVVRRKVAEREKVDVALAG